MNRITLAVLGTFIVLLLGCGLLAYVLRDHSERVVTTTATPSSSPGTESKSATPDQTKIPLIGELFGPDASGLSPSSISSWESASARIAANENRRAILA